ncbi:tRNA1(Val) (adenine(37)-N6)-methyltransferase [Croceimicrobium hydrocarbonivorans]|uniref:Methyltransferase n=1 Tax=Croceimicrobium hydrocarbonivorans TaxID=2761580 RepID=A0A7H0VCF1_9FLAO|nr:methyltransferase [Croceimicrobium hydrocarbonivorans]QNR23399.1 methyltransferase [Croceimicrobium hydrocarbonivorans]
MPKSPTPFQFQKFSLAHDQSAHKIGTDSLALAGWVEASNPNAILDFGSGSGLLSIIMAQRFTEASIVGLEIDKASWQQSCENAKSCPWSKRIQFHHQDLRDWNTERRYDLIISNPPYFSESLLAPEKRRAQARSASAETFLLWMQKLRDLLSADGSLALVLPPLQWESYQDQFREMELYPRRMALVHHHESAEASRVLIQLSKQASSLEKEKLILYASAQSHIRHPQYQILVQDFMLPQNG